MTLTPKPLILMLCKLLHKSLWFNILSLCCKIKITSITQNSVQLIVLQLCIPICFMGLGHPQHAVHSIGSPSVSEVGLIANIPHRVWTPCHCTAFLRRSIQSRTPLVFDWVAAVQPHYTTTSRTTTLQTTTHNLNLVMHDVHHEFE